MIMSFIPTVGLSFSVISSFKITDMALGGFSLGQSLLGITVFIGDLFRAVCPLGRRNNPFNFPSLIV